MVAFRSAHRFRLGCHRAAAAEGCGSCSRDSDWAWSLRSFDGRTLYRDAPGDRGVDFRRPFDWSHADRRSSSAFSCRQACVDSPGKRWRPEPRRTLDLLRGQRIPLYGPQIGPRAHPEASNVAIHVRGGHGVGRHGQPTPNGRSMEAGRAVLIPHRRALQLQAYNVVSDLLSGCAE